MALIAKFNNIPLRVVPGTSLARILFDICVFPLALAPEHWCWVVGFGSETLRVPRRKGFSAKDNRRSKGPTH
jgi:hypothetical protein